MGRIEPERHAAVAAHRVARVDPDLLDDRQSSVQGPAGSDQDFVAGGHDRLGRITDGSRHMAVMVDQGAVDVQGHHELLGGVVLAVVSLVVVASD
ncbi:hypothetical protein D9M68_815610 [compost metagenome]